MPVEQDDEVTTFDPQPWGAMQRVLPSARFHGRTSGALQAASVATIPSLPFVVPRNPSIARFAPPGSLRMASELPLTAFGAEVDCTMRVRRRPLTTRSLIAAPIGALLAALVLVISHLGSSTPASAPASVRMATVDHAMPVLTPPPSAPVAAVAAIAAEPAEAEIETGPVDAEAATPLAAPIAKSSKSSRATKRVRHRPRKIVAVDSSTPLGNLRPRRF